MATVTVRNTVMAMVSIMAMVMATGMVMRLRIRKRNCDLEIDAFYYCLR